MKENSVKKAAISGMLWKFLERCSAQIIGLLVSIILARILDPEEFGIVAITMIFISLADVFIVSGFGVALIQHGKYDEEEFSTMFWAGLFLSIILYILLVSVSPFIAKAYQNDIFVNVLIVLGIRLPMSAYNSIQQAYITQQMLFRNFFYCTIIGTSISAIVGIYIALTGGGVWALVGQNLVMTFVNMLVLRVLVPWRPKFIFSKEKFYQLFSYSWRITMTSFIGTLFDQLRGFIIGFYYRPSDLAFCSHGERLPQAVASNISTSVDTVMFAALSKVKEDKTRFLCGVRKAMCMGSFLVVPIMAIMAGAAYQFVEIVLTKRWLDVVPYMQLVCLQQMLSVLSTINIQSIKASGRADICLKLEIWKKPLYLSILLFTMWISPIMMVAGNTFYSFLGFLINTRPNKRLFNYGFREQWYDVRGNFINGFLVFLLVWWIGRYIGNVYLAFIVQILVGLVGYWMLAMIGKLRGYDEICKYIQRRRPNL